MNRISQKLSARYPYLSRDLRFRRQRQVRASRICLKLTIHICQLIMEEKNIESLVLSRGKRLSSAYNENDVIKEMTRTVTLKEKYSTGI